MTPSILFVCLGNICRSPLAEAAFVAEAARIGLAVEVASAGTGNWHVGDPPDPRAQATALAHGIDISGYRGRQVKPADFRRFTHIVAMDADNLANLRRLAPPDATADLSLMLNHAGRPGQSVADPYFGDDAGFEITWNDVSVAAAGLAQTLRLSR
jgi:protein-tyrosine phosphatase